MHVCNNNNINTTLLDHEPQHKYTLQNTRDQESTIDHAMIIRCKDA
jgi:hypothetical protein